jgi:rod shape-determining protein MreB
VGGGDIDAGIATALRLQYGMVAAPATIEWLKFTLANADDTASGERHTIEARTTARGERTSVTVGSELVDAATRDVVATTVRMVEECLGSTPPDLSHDLAQRGIALVGGGAQLRGLDDVLTTSTGVRCTVAPDPDRVIIRGLEACLDEMAGLYALFRAATR